MKQIKAKCSQILGITRLLGPEATHPHFSESENAANDQLDSK